VIIAGPNGRKDFFIGVHFDARGVVAKIDRAAAFLKGRTIGDVVDLARRRGWRVSLSADEVAQIGQVADDLTDSQSRRG
jgi:hypothetical protein